MPAVPEVEVLVFLVLLASIIASDFRNFVKLVSQRLFAVDVHCINLALSVLLESLELGGLFHHFQAQFNPFRKSRAIQFGIEGRDRLHEVLQLGHLAFDDIASVIHDWKNEVMNKLMVLTGDS